MIRAELDRRLQLVVVEVDGHNGGGRWAASAPSSRSTAPAVALSPRHSEIVTLLMLRPQGFTSEQLAVELFDDGTKRMSVRAEISRLRRVLGPRCSAEPYRLTGGVSSDLHDVERLLAAGRDDSARKLAFGPPLSRSPACG